MKVCNLTDGKELHTDMFGNPFLTHAPNGLRMAGWCSEVTGNDFVDSKDLALVLAWQKDLSNDCLRGRGDARWQAASAFLQHHPWPITALAEPRA